MRGVRGDSRGVVAEVGVMVGNYSPISMAASTKIARSDSSNNNSKDTVGRAGGVLLIISSLGSYSTPNSSTNKSTVTGTGASSTANPPSEVSRVGMVMAASGGQVNVLVVQDSGWGGETK